MQANPGRPLALFGGTFDPTHYGHLRCAEEARIKLGLEQVLLMPSGNPPHRNQPRASATQRLDMLRLAVEEFPCLGIDECEIHREGPSYMVDTLLDVRRQVPHQPVLLLLGQDAANQLQSWHRWQQLFELAHIVILTRPATRNNYTKAVAAQVERRRTFKSPDLYESPAGRVFTLTVTSIDISASKIRRMLDRGEHPNGKLPPAVVAYIEHNKLYIQG
jgi:nicotinate-nucleotide adenylyltransferase